MQFNAEPSAAFNFSLSKESKWGLSYFSYQDQMKSKFENTARGFTPVGATLNYNWDLSSVLFYDPVIIRLGHKYKNFIATLEYQDWSGYETPILQMEAGSSSTLISSQLEENFSTDSILIPKIGYMYKGFSFGASYKPSPLKLKAGSSGNSVDTSFYSTSVGYKRSFTLFEQDIMFKSGFTYHFLETQTVSKDPLRENGTVGNKIGAPNYEIGGDVYALSIGLSWVL